MSEQPNFNPETLSGVSFFDVASTRNMRYIYPDVGHWTAGWLIVQNRSGAWMTLRKATAEDLAAINAAVVQSHHGGKD